MNTKQAKRGFTLMEVLIYTAILSITGTILSGVLLNTTKIKGRQTAVIEVNEQLNFVLQNVQRSIMDSSIIDIENSVSTSTLVLRYKDETKNPTQFYVSDNIVYKKEAANTPQPLTDNSVIANAINFLKVSGYSGHDSLQIDLTLSYNTNNPVSAFSRTLSSAIARVSAATFDSDLVPGSSIHDLGTSENKWQDLYVSGITNFGGVGYTWPAADGTDGQNLSTNGLGVLSWSEPAGYWSALGNNISNTNTGNVGIGTTAPLGKLSLTNNNVSTVGLYFRSDDGTLNNMDYSSGRIQSGWETGEIDFNQGFIKFDNVTAADTYSTTMTLKGGNVGIGTTAPLTKLNVQTADVIVSPHVNADDFMIENTGEAGMTILAGSANGSNIFFGDAESAIVGQLNYNHSDNSMRFITNQSDVMRITSAGNVGIGTTMPGSFNSSANNLVVGNGTSNSGITIFGPTTGNSNIFFADGISSSDAYRGIISYEHTNDAFAIYTAGLNERVRITSLGYVGIGMTPSYQLQLSSDSAAKPGTNTWTIASDSRIKKDIKPFTDGLSVINNINPVWYKYNGQGGFAADGKDYIGIIAQDIEKIAPYTVSSFEAKLNPNDTTTTTLYNFNSHALTFNLINAVKEQQKQIEELKNKISELEARIK